MAITWDMVSRDCTVIKIPAELIKSRQPLTVVLVGSQLEPIAAMLRKMLRTKVRCLMRRITGPSGIKHAPKLVWGHTIRRREFGQAPRIHDCRCSAAVNLIEAGVSEDIVMKVGGWKTKAMFSRYNVMNVDRIKAAMIKGGKYVADKMKATG